MAKPTKKAAALAAELQNSSLLQNIDEKATPEMPSPEFELQYNPIVAGHIKEAKDNEFIGDLDLSRVPLTIAIKDVDSLTPEQFTMSRRDGFGASDSSIIMGVNPYTTLEQLIQQKTSGVLSADEKAISLKVAVRKGNDLEPLIMEKTSKIFGEPVVKPKDTYAFTNYPWIRINFDGVIDNDHQYIPVELKVATRWGQKHYNPSKAIYSEMEGWKPMPIDVSDQNMSLETKAANYGIPPYYYTQVQVEIMACNAPYGYLAVIFDNDWIVHMFMVYADRTMQSDFIVNSFKAWQKVEALRCQLNGTGSDSTWMEPLQSSQPTKDQDTSDPQSPQELKSPNDY